MKIAASEAASEAAPAAAPEARDDFNAATVGGREVMIEMVADDTGETLQVDGFEPGGVDGDTICEAGIYSGRGASRAPPRLQNPFTATRRSRVVHVHRGDPESPGRQNDGDEYNREVSPRSITRWLTRRFLPNVFDTVNRPLLEGGRPRLSLTGRAALARVGSLVTYIL